MQKTQSEWFSKSFLNDIQNVPLTECLSSKSDKKS